MATDRILRFPCQLPDDPLGIPHGMRYRSKLQAGRDSAYSTDSLRWSRKNGCVSHSLGIGERDMFFLLELSPFVLAYRFQYPWLLLPGRILVDDYVSGLRDIPPMLKKRDVISMDVVITALDKKNGLKYIVGSHKLHEHLRLKKVRKRISLERSEAAAACFGYFVFSRTPLLDEQAKSAKQIVLWGNGVDFNIEATRSREIAEDVYRLYRGEAIEICLHRIATRHSTDIDTVFKLFSAAVHLGHLSVDLSLPVRAWKSIRLIAPEEAMPPWESLINRSARSITG